MWLINGVRQSPQIRAQPIGSPLAQRHVEPRVRLAPHRHRGTQQLNARGRDRDDGAAPILRADAVPDGIRLIFVPPYTAELQPAETLWVRVDAPVVNKHFETLDDLDAVVDSRCVALGDDRELIRGQAGFHWWPMRRAPN